MKDTQQASSRGRTQLLSQVAYTFHFHHPASIHTDVLPHLLPDSQ